MMMFMLHSFNSLVSGQTAGLEGRHNAAACIQRRWRKYACQEGTADMPLSKLHYRASNNFKPEISIRQRQMKYLQLPRVVTTLQVELALVFPLMLDHWREKSKTKKKGSDTLIITTESWENGSVPKDKNKSIQFQSLF